MSFYNPYMKTPDWGQGIGDIQDRILQILTLGMMGKQQGPSDFALSQLKPMMPNDMPTPQMGGAYGSAGGMMGGGAGGMGAGGAGGGMAGIDPQMLMQLLKMLGMGGGGMGGGIPGFAGGGIVTRPTFATLGERGPEAIVPLGRRFGFGGGGGYGGFNPGFSPINTIPTSFNDPRYNNPGAGGYVVPPVANYPYSRQPIGPGGINPDLNRPTIGGYGYPAPTARPRPRPFQQRGRVPSF